MNLSLKPNLPQPKHMKMSPSSGAQWTTNRTNPDQPKLNSLGEVSLAERTAIISERSVDLRDNIRARQLALALVLQEPALVAVRECVVLRVYMHTAVVLLRVELPSSGGAEPPRDVRPLGGASGRHMEIAPVELPEVVSMQQCVSLNQNLRGEHDAGGERLGAARLLAVDILRTRGQSYRSIIYRCLKARTAASLLKATNQALITRSSALSSASVGLLWG